MPAARGSRCLVTGGAGFIGSHLTARLVALGHDVRVVDDLSSGDEANLRPVRGSIDFVRGDLRESEVCRRAVEGTDIVFHLAARVSAPASVEDPVSTHEVNVGATMHLLEACRAAGVRRVVYSSSCAVYGDAAGVPASEHGEVAPASPYAASKLAGEQYVLSFARAGMIEGVALRYFNVFGPRQSASGAYAAVVPNFLQAARDGSAAVIYGDGKQTRDFVYVENVVDANILGATVPAANGRAFNVGAGRSTSLLELIEAIRKVTGVALGHTTQPLRAGDVRDSMASLERAASVLGFRPKVSLEDGLRHVWSWLVGRSEVDNPAAATSQRD